MTEPLPPRGASAPKPITITNEIKKGAIAKTLTTALIAIVVLVALIGIASIVFGVTAIRSKQNNNSGILHSTNQAAQQAAQAAQAAARTNRLLVECTTPGTTHKCYNDAQGRTGKALGRFENIVIAANYCATLPTVHTLKQQFACVQKQLPNLPAPK